MSDELETLMLARSPTPERPLLGLTVLVVEDSLYACEAMRLLCLRSGARIRRADSLKSAQKHLSVFRPVVVIIDIGLPDGSGVELIANLASSRPRVPVILGISGDPGSEDQVLAAGANGFLQKPLLSLAKFQAAVLQHLPRSRRPRRPRLLDNDMITPDPLALRDDLTHMDEILNDPAASRQSAAYVAQFLGALARLTGDRPVRDAARDLENCRRLSRPMSGALDRIAALVRDRLQRMEAQSEPWTAQSAAARQ